MDDATASRRFEDEPHDVVDRDVVVTSARAQPAARRLEAVPAPSTPPSVARPETLAVVAARPKRRWVRQGLFALLPVALVAGGYAYVTGGHIMMTDNAYVGARSLGVSTDVAGTVAAVEVRDNQAVTKGQVLFRLRGESFRIALEGAKAQLGTVRNQVLTLQATYKQSLSQIDQAKADLPFYETAFQRQKDLIAGNVSTKASYDQASHDLVASQAKVAVAKTQAQAMLAQLGGDPAQQVEENPFYLQAKSAVDNAQRDLDDTLVRAPFDGIVTNVDSLQVGGYLQAAQAAFSLISTADLWVDASPKETELTNIVPGQKATITVDTYPGLEWQGSVDSISPASGSSFSMLPAQNTTGNWVKVVQRMPMRIRIDSSADRPPLRVGMSAVVSVETGKARGLPEFVKPWLDRLGIHHG